MKEKIVYQFPEKTMKRTCQNFGAVFWQNEIIQIKNNVLSLPKVTNLNEAFCVLQSVAEIKILTFELCWK